MRTGKGNQEEEEYGDEDYASKREGPSSSIIVHSNNNSNTAVSRDARENDKASAIRSKHSVTEQRRRSKINERFQILRELIPNSEQKKDTASFLLEVIEYVQYLQEKVQKCEGSYPGWSPEPTKLMPWRNNHWRVQSLTNHPLAIANGSGPGIPFPGKFEENTVNSTPGIGAEMQKPTVSDQGRAIACKSIDSQTELDDKRLPPVQLIPPLIQAAQSNESPATRDEIGQNNDLVIEGGTISISSDYSHELLSSLTQALQNAGIDLSNARLSVQIDLGKRANQGLTHDASSNKNPLPSDIQGTTQPREEACVEEESEHSHKRMKTK